VRTGLCALSTIGAQHRRHTDTVHLRCLQAKAGAQANVYADTAQVDIPSAEAIVRTCHGDWSDLTYDAVGLQGAGSLL
jgi:hypothetical protein